MRLLRPHPPSLQFCVARIAGSCLCEHSPHDMCLRLSCLVSLELVSVEAPVIEIVVVIAHVIHFQLLLFLSHQHVEELGAIMVVVQVNLAVQGVQEAREVCQEDQEEHQDHQRK